MNFEQFIYGQFDGVGYRLIKSPHVDEILSRYSLNYLLKLRGSGSRQTWLPEMYIAISHLDHNKDEYGRKAIWNHTILVPMRDYFKLNPPTQFTDHFIHELDKAPAALTPLKVKM